MRQSYIRRFISAIVAAAIISSCTVTGFAQEQSRSAVEISCRSAILMESTTGEVLFEYNADSHEAPASITKIMTMLLVMEALENGQITLEDKVTASPYACSMGGSQIWLEPMETMTVHEMLKATAIGSANDASVALAEHLSGSEGAFVEMMNRRAQELGMANTNFVNACGLDEDGHYTSARDIATMACELLSHEQITGYTSTWMDSLRGGETELVNTNRLVRFYQGCNGLKTGTTDNAGSCLAASATRGDLSLVSVVLGSKTSNERFDSARALLDYGFANFYALPTPDVSEQLAPVRVKNGEHQWVTPVANPPQMILVEKAAKNSIEQRVELLENVQAPVAEGQKIGTVTVLVEGAPKSSYDIVAAESVGRMTFFKALYKLVCAVTGSPQP